MKRYRIDEFVNRVISCDKQNELRSMVKDFVQFMDEHNERLNELKNTQKPHIIEIFITYSNDNRMLINTLIQSTERLSRALKVEKCESYEEAIVNGICQSLRDNQLMDVLLAGLHTHRVYYPYVHDCEERPYNLFKGADDLSELLTFFDLIGKSVDVKRTFTKDMDFFIPMYEQYANDMEKYKTGKISEMPNHPPISAIQKISILTKNKLPSGYENG